MKAKRQTATRRGTDRRHGSDNAARKSARGSTAQTASRRTRPAGKASAPTRELRAPQSGPQTTPMSRPVERPARPKSAAQLSQLPTRQAVGQLEVLMSRRADDKKFADVLRVMDLGLGVSRRQRHVQWIDE